MSIFDTDNVYILDGMSMKNLRGIMLRLYDDKILGGDERRDLANRLEAVLSSAQKWDDELDGDC